jgi:hypothetical protein
VIVGDRVEGHAGPKSIKRATVNEVIFVIATMAGAGEGAAVSRRITGNALGFPINP